MDPHHWTPSEHNPAGFFFLHPPLGVGKRHHGRRKPLVIKVAAPRYFGGGLRQVLTSGPEAGTGCLRRLDPSPANGKDGNRNNNRSAEQNAVRSRPPVVAQDYALSQPDRTANADKIRHAPDTQGSAASNYKNPQVNITRFHEQTIDGTFPRPPHAGAANPPC